MDAGDPKHRGAYAPLALFLSGARGAQFLQESTSRGLAAQIIASVLRIKAAAAQSLRGRVVLLLGGLAQPVAIVVCIGRGQREERLAVGAIVEGVELGALRAPQDVS